MAGGESTPAPAEGQEAAGEEAAKRPVTLRGARRGLGLGGAVGVCARPGQGEEASSKESRRSAEVERMLMVLVRLERLEVLLE